MGIDFAGDLGEMLSADDHGAIVERDTGAPVEGILNNEFLAVDPGASVEVDGSQPAIYVPTPWASDIKRGDAITVTPTDASGCKITSRAQSFTVATAPEDDGQGLSRVALQTE